MMILYSGSTDPFSHRCRFVLYEKGGDFEVVDVDPNNKPPEIDAMNPYGEVPILIERDLTLYQSNIINEYIDERFPHPQLMPADPIMRARARLFIYTFERELFGFVRYLEKRDADERRKAIAREQIREQLVQLSPILSSSCLLAPTILACFSSSVTWNGSPADGISERPIISTGSEGPALFIFLPLSSNMALTRPG